MANAMGSHVLWIAARHTHEAVGSIFDFFIKNGILFFRTVS